MNEQVELTREELLKMLPEMNLADGWTLSGGGPISPREAADRVAAYRDYKNEPANSNIKDQTVTIGFDSRRLIDWLNQNKDLMDEVQVFLTLDRSNRKFNIVLWPYKGGGPAEVREGKEEARALLSPFNIGNRRP